MSFDSVHRPLGTFYVCRRINKPVNEYVTNLWNGRRKLDLDCLDGFIVHLSLNLLGRDFKEPHICFRQTGDGDKDWKGGKVDFERYKGDYSDLNDAYPLYYCSSSLHRRRIPQKLHFEPQDKGAYNALRDKVKSLALDTFKGKATDVDVLLELFIEHHPTNLNYWHVQMEVKPALDDDRDKLKDDRSWRSDIYTQSVSDILSTEFLEELPSIPYLPPCCSCSWSKRCTKSGR